MSRNLKKFNYEIKSDYDKRIRLNGKDVDAYSKSKLDELYPNNDPVFVGEILENKKQKNDDVGRIELANKFFNIAPEDKFSRAFKKEVGYIAISDGRLITVLKKRLLLIIILIGMLVGLAGFGTYYYIDNYYQPDTPVEPVDPDPIEPIEEDLVSVTGYVSIGDEYISGAIVSIYVDEELVDTCTTGTDGKYIFANVKNSTYTIVCSYGQSELRSSVRVDNKAVEYSFKFPDAENSSIKSLVKKTNEDMPAIAVKGLDTEVIAMAESNKDVQLTLLATKLEEEEIKNEEKQLFEKQSGELELSYFDLSLLKEIFYNSQLETSSYLKGTSQVLEIAIAFDSSKSEATYVFRNHDNGVEKFTELDERPTSDYQDGTYYVTRTAVYLYTDKFSTYAIGAAISENVIKGEDTFTYSNVVTISKTDRTIELLYKRDSSSTNPSKIQIYLKGQSTDYLIGESGIVKAGYKLEKMNVLSSIDNLPSVGTYKGYMHIIYLDANGEKVITNADVEISVVIKN